MDDQIKLKKLKDQGSRQPLVGGCQFLYRQKMHCMDKAFLWWPRAAIRIFGVFSSFSFYIIFHFTYLVYFICCISFHSFYFILFHFQKQFIIEVK